MKRGLPHHDGAGVVRGRGHGHGADAIGDAPAEAPERIAVQVDDPVVRQQELFPRGGPHIGSSCIRSGFRIS
jgi:hypothetical protein